MTTDERLHQIVFSRSYPLETLASYTGYRQSPPANARQGDMHHTYPSRQISPGGKDHAAVAEINARIHLLRGFEYCCTA